MTVDQLPFNDLTSPAGIAAVAVVIRQLIEFAKHSFIPWLDHGNERKGAYIIAAGVYVAWLAAYGSDLSADGPRRVLGGRDCGHRDERGGRRRQGRRRQQRRGFDGPRCGRSRHPE